MESDCAITPICGMTCAICPAFDADLKPTTCKVMSALIRAFQAQEDYWGRKISSLVDMEGLLYGIEQRLDSMEKELKDNIKEAVRDIRGS